MHSNDFCRGLKDTIDGKSQSEWEAEFEIVGMVEHLKGLGWDRYQWRYRHVAPGDTRGCFAEFFSSFFNGYLRGDGATVREAVERCLNRAQKFAKCDKDTGHSYLPYRQRPDAEEYTNGLVACVHCGFNGYTTIVKHLQQTVDHYRIHAEVSQERAAEQERYMEEHGETMGQALDRRIREEEAKRASQLATADESGK